MSFGLRIVNPGNELVLSSDARGLYCIGKAVLQSLTQSSGDPLTSLGKVAGKSVYRISHGGSILVALDLPLNGYVSGLDLVQVSTGVWDIAVSHGYSFDSDLMITTQVALDVWAFGLPQGNTPFGPFGLIIRDGAGNLAWDLSRPNPLFPRAYISGPPTLLTASFSLPSLTRPVVLCVCGSSQTLDARSVNTHTVTNRRGAFVRGSSTSMDSVMIVTGKSRYFAPEDGNQIDDPSSVSSFILEGALLP